MSNLEARPPPAGDRARGGVPGLKRKRPLEEGNGGHLCPLRLLWRRLSWSVAPKNALVQLHELRPGLQFRMVSQTGPVHAPIFAVAVDVNGLTFEGTGPTKKKAKMRAAELALRSFVQLPNAGQAPPAPGGMAPDFTSDQADFPDALFQRFEPAAPSEGFPGGRRPPASECLSTACQRGRLLGHPLDLGLGGPTAPGTGNPVVLLNELRSGLRYVCLSEPEKRRAQSFVMAVSVDGRTFEGSGRSKKLAKGQAAQAALQALFDIRLPGHVPSRSRSHLLPQVRALGWLPGGGVGWGQQAVPLLHPPVWGAPMPPKQAGAAPPALVQKPSSDLGTESLKANVGREGMPGDWAKVMESWAASLFGNSDAGHKGQGSGGRAPCPREGSTAGRPLGARHWYVRCPLACSGPVGCSVPVGVFSVHWCVQCRSACSVPTGLFGAHWHVLCSWRVWRGSGLSL